MGGRHDHGGIGVPPGRLCYCCSSVFTKSYRGVLTSSPHRAGKLPTFPDGPKIMVPNIVGERAADKRMLRVPQWVNAQPIFYCNLHRKTVIEQLTAPIRQN